MNTQIKMSLFIRDLLDLQESSIVKGRANLNRKLYNELQIAVDFDGSESSVYSSEYKSENEIQQINSTNLFSFDINFYGDEAQTKADEFCLLIKSQKSKNIQSQLEFTVCSPKRKRNLKFLDAPNFSDRVQIEINVIDNKQIEVETLAMENAVFHKIYVEE